MSSDGDAVPVAPGASAAAKQPAADAAEEATRGNGESRVVVFPAAEYTRLVRQSQDLASGMAAATSERLKLSREVRLGLLQTLKHTAIEISAALRRRELEQALADERAKNR